MYNGDGLRTEKWGDRTTQYIILDGTYLGERTSFYGGINYLITYIYGTEGSVIGLDVNGTAYYFVKNLQGDVTSIIDVNGNVVANYTYDAYGYCMSITDGNGNEVTSDTHIANLNPFRYRGYMYDQETGFYYLRSRYYDPAVCRFLNADGMVSTGVGLDGYNMLAYCNGNPVMFSDPFGNCPGTSIHIRRVCAGLEQCEIKHNAVDQFKASIAERWNEIVRPIDGGKFKINDYPDYPSGGFHGACDIVAPLETAVYAAFSGVVVESEKDWSYGTNIVVMSTINGI